MSSGLLALAGKQIVAGVLLVILGLFQPGWMGLTVFAQAGALRIAVLEGNNRVVKKDKDLRLVVEVRNDSKVPVAGADVTFIAPESGPGILFAENASRLTVKTDSFGRANSGFARSVGDGPFQVTIVASYQGQTASTKAQAVNQTSPAASTSDVQKKSSLWKWILIGAGAGAAAGIVVAKSGSDSDSASTTPTITVTPPVIGPPQ